MRNRVAFWRVWPLRASDIEKSASKWKGASKLYDWLSVVALAGLTSLRPSAIRRSGGCGKNILRSHLLCSLLCPIRADP